MLLLSGQRATVRHSLQMEVTTQRDNATWTGSAAIPVIYLPKKVSLAPIPVCLVLAATWVNILTHSFLPSRFSEDLLTKINFS